MATDHQLRHHNRQTDNENADKINEDEGTSAVLSGDVGELPDIAEADGATGGSQDKSEARGPLSSGGRIVQALISLALSQYVAGSTLLKSKLLPEVGHFIL